MYVDSSTSNLMRIPGEAASVMTCIDGYAMARKGRGGAALAIAAVGSYIAGTVSVVGLMFLAPPLAAFALRFGPPEYLALLTLGLLVLAYMSSGSMLKSLAMAALGLLLGMIGIDQMTGYFRYAYRVVELGDGLGVVPVAVGLFGVAGLLATAGQPTPPAVMLAAIMVHGVSPGPLLIQQQPALFWGFIASMYVGNVMLLILNLPLVGLFVNILRVPYPYLYPAILVFATLGVYAVNNSVVDVWIMLATGVLGWILRKLDFETAPIVLGVVLAPMIELSLRQSLAMSDGHYAIFLQRPIAVTLVAPFPPGGVADLTARPVAAAMEKVLKNPVGVVNKTGAAGAVGMQYVATSRPDGYTLLLALSSISIIPEADKIFDRPPAFTVDQFAPIALISADPTILVVPADKPWKTAKDFIEDAKKRPGQISYSSSGIYGTLHMAMELLSHSAGIKLRHIPTPGAGPALTAILGGHVDALASGPAVGLPHIKSGQLPALARRGGQRGAAVPGGPTLKERRSPHAGVYTSARGFAPRR